MEILIPTLAAAVWLGLVPAAIARKKGRPFLAWWVYGTLLFIIALPHALLMSPLAGSEGSLTTAKQGEATVGRGAFTLRKAFGLIISMAMIFGGLYFAYHTAFFGPPELHRKYILMMVSPSLVLFGLIWIYSDWIAKARR
jgi:hypothetical protein